jgi:hypothetical protein
MLVCVRVCVCVWVCVWGYVCTCGCVCKAVEAGDVKKKQRKMADPRYNRGTHGDNKACFKYYFNLKRLIKTFIVQYYGEWEWEGYFHRVGKRSQQGLNEGMRHELRCSEAWPVQDRIWLGRQKTITQHTTQLNKRANNELVQARSTIIDVCLCMWLTLHTVMRENGQGNSVLGEETFNVPVDERTHETWLRFMSWESWQW